MCKGYKKTCWLPAKLLCGSCEYMKKVDEAKSIIDAGQEYPRTADMSFIKAGQNFDNMAYDIYKKDKVALNKFLNRFADVFNYKIYTHSNTNLCPVFSYYIRQGQGSQGHETETPMPNCLSCLAHVLRYSKDKYVQSLILRSVVFYQDGPNIQSIVKKATNTNNESGLASMGPCPLIKALISPGPRSQPLYEFGAAIIEVQGIDGVFDTYIELINNIPLAVSLQKHPLLHKTLLEQSDVLKRGIYKLFRHRKRIFYEELYAKAYHPSRFMQWCFTEDQKEGMDISPYIFQDKGSPWNIEWV